MVAKANAQQENVDDDGFLCLRGDRFWKWRALDADARLAMVELDSVNRQIEAEIARHPELTSLFSRQMGLKGALVAAKAELVSAQQEIEAHFGIQLKACSIDDKTGRIHLLPDGGERGAPVKKPSKRKR